ncbi:MAG: DUF4434 domain-containing protein, partial [Clostridia bacterium]|nr:DUF4434 domain-containing protein [Clostridia bacterium]
MSARSKNRVRCLLLAALLILSAFCACGTDEPAEESGQPAAAEGILSARGVVLRVPGEYRTDGETAIVSDGGLRIDATWSADALSSMTKNTLQKQALLKDLTDYLQDGKDAVPCVTYLFANKADVRCGQILTENGSGELVCFTLTGLPAGETGENGLRDIVPFSLSVKQESGEGSSDMNRKETEPSPASMHSAGISPITGTFIQSWLYVNYTEERWNNEFRLMKEMGIDSVIMGDTLSIQTGNPITDASQYVVTANYPTQNPSFQTGRDVLTVLFDYCKAYGMKLYVGMGNTTVGWPYLNSDVTGLKEVASVFADAAEDLYRVYAEKYPETFAGFYFVPELYNSSEFDGQASRVRYAERLAAGMQPIFDRIHSISDLPFIFSPYVNMFGGGWVSKDTGNIGAFWQEFLERADFRDGDILCPQDSVGAGGNDLDGLEAVTKAYRDAVDGCGKQIVLWTNAEIFIQPTGKYFDNFDGYGGYWSTCTVDRMIRQFQIASKYVDRIFTFAFPHYLSPYNTTDGYLKTYRAYLETGELDSVPPVPPDTFRTSKLRDGGKDVLQIVWSGMYDNMGVHRVNIYKNGEFCNYRNCTRNEGSGKQAEYPYVFNDTEFEFDSDEPVVYSFEVVDCAGNVSPRVEFTVTASSVPNRVQLG